MAAVDYRSLAGQILEKVGGEGNVASVAHCATRLRFKLKDTAKADKAAVEKLTGVITVVEAGGQFQVVIGNDVPIVYAEIGQLTKLIGDNAPVADEGPKGNLLNQFIDLISKIMSPILWPLAGAGLLKAFLALATQLNWMDPAGQTYTILNAAGDAIIYFLPIFLGFTAAKRFGAHQVTAMALAAALVYPSIVALNNGEPVHFLGIPVVMVSYTSSVIPIIVAVWLQSYVEKWLNKVLPSAIRNFSTPLIVLTVMVPFTLITVGPITSWLANTVSAGVTGLFNLVPWLAGGILGGFWQVFVMFGLHWGFIPIMLNDLTGPQGYSLLSGPLPAAVLAQAAATLAVAFRSRSAKRRQIAGASSVSGLLAGITEPAIYGVNLPLKRPFYFGIAGGAVGGAIAAAGGSAATAFVFPSIIGLPAYMEQGSFALQLIGTGIAIGLAFTLTFLFGVKDSPDEPEAAEDAPQIVVGGVGAPEVKAPVSGTLVPLGEINDKVFASGALGNGLGIVPSNGQFYAPFAGTVATAFPTGHAFGIKSPDGVEVLIHIGIDTVQLDGKGFNAAVTQGQEVQAGDLLCTVDLEAVKAAGYDTTTIVVITNTAQFAAVLPAEGHEVAHGDTVVVIER